ncbi:ATP-binding protein [Rossellomorea vietnamensis]|nr:ATP-binding protein [Rossellomorea vietnamensis]
MKSPSSHKKTLDMLRQPLESGSVTISRAHSTVNYPASFILIGAMNPCPCGYLHSFTNYCTCTPKQITAYHNRLSGPIRDRFDIHLSLKPVDLQREQQTEKEDSEVVRKRISEARERQHDRYGEQICNGRVTYDRLLKNSSLSHSQHQLIRQLSSKNHLSNRALIKILRLDRTIADLGLSEEILDEHIWEGVKLQRRGQGSDQSLFLMMVTVTPRDLSKVLGCFLLFVGGLLFFSSVFFPIPFIFS